MPTVLLMTFNASYIHPNLALRWLYVARDQKYDVIIKEFTISDDIQKVKQAIAEINPDIIGMSIYIWNAEISKKLIRELEPFKYRIIIGGPEVTYEYQEWLNENIEAIIKGEGEISFWRACNGEVDVPGLVSRQHHSNSLGTVDIAYLEQLESPYFLAMDDESRPYRYLYFETSRGCPYQCSYCLSSLDNRVRNFSLDYIKKQLLMLKSKPVKQVKFLDRTFNSHPKRALEIASFINDLDVNVSFQFEVALEHFPSELLNFFAKTKPGKFRFEVGVQTFNEKTLKAINRNQNAERLSANIRFFKKHKLVMHTDLIAGLPYEDYASFKTSFYRLFELQSDEIQMGILKLLKGTALKAQSQKTKMIYNPLPPYEIISTAWVTKPQMDKIKMTAKVIDKTYNNGRLRACFDTLYKEGYDIFEIMAEFGARLMQVEKLQIKDYFRELYVVLCKYNYSHSQELLLNDYYRHFNEKPAPLFKRPDVEVRKALYQHLIKLGWDEHELNEYSILDYGYYHQKRCYQLVTYGKNHRRKHINYIDFDFQVLMAC